MVIIKGREKSKLWSKNAKSFTNQIVNGWSAKIHLELMCLKGNKCVIKRQLLNWLLKEKKREKKRRGHVVLNKSHNRTRETRDHFTTIKTVQVVVLLVLSYTFVQL